MDRKGHDTYLTDKHAICGAAWDRSVAYFEDTMGNDTYKSPGPFSFGAVDHNGIAFHLDFSGQDSYANSFYTTQSNSYHGGSSLGIFVNLKGKDNYPPSFLNQDTKVKNDFVFIDQ